MSVCLYIIQVNVLLFCQTEVKVEASAVKQLLEGGVVGEDGEEVGLLHAGHTPIMIRGEDGVLYQVSLRFTLKFI